MNSIKNCFPRKQDSEFFNEKKGKIAGFLFDKNGNRTILKNLGQFTRWVVLLEKPHNLSENCMVFENIHLDFVSILSCL